jgi:hypothetical protein
MLVSMKLGSDLSAGCALSVIRPAFLLTYPTLPFVDRFATSSWSVGLPEGIQQPAMIDCDLQVAPDR